MNECGKYVGIKSTCQIPDNCCYKVLHETVKFRNKTVHYWECWIPDSDKLKPVFGEWEEPKPNKIKNIEKRLRIFFGG